MQYYCNGSEGREPKSTTTGRYFRVHRYLIGVKNRQGSKPGRQTIRQTNPREQAKIKKPGTRQDGQE